MNQNDELKKEEEEWRKNAESIMVKSVLPACEKSVKIIEAKGWKGKLTRGDLSIQVDAFAQGKGIKQTIRFYYPLDTEYKPKDRLLQVGIINSDTNRLPGGHIHVGRIEQELKDFCEKLPPVN